MIRIKNNILYILFISTVSALGGILFGYDTGVISGTISLVTDQFNLNSVQQGWYVSSALLGSIIGVAFAGVLSDFSGRKRTLFLSSVLFTVSAAGCAFSGNFIELVVFRLIGGLGIGVVSIVSPMYISEMSIPKYRGRLVSLYQLAITVGFLGSYLVNYRILKFGQLNEFKAAWINHLFHAEIWRGMLGMETFVAFLFLCILFVIPESPRWLILKQKESRALTILYRMNASIGKAQQEMSEIKSVVARRNKETEWKYLFHPGILKIVIIGISLAILGQFMGINAVMYYGPQIFMEAGISDGDSLFYQVLVGLVNVLTTILALAIIDHVGRKKMVYYGVSSIFISLIAISFYFRFGEEIGIPPVGMLVLFLFYIFSCAISINAVIWVLLSELFPLNVRGLSMSIAGLALWLGTFLTGQLTPWLLENLTPSGTFILFSIMCIPYILIVWKLIPETAGKSLEELEQEWTLDKNP